MYRTLFAAALGAVLLAPGPLMAADTAVKVQEGHPKYGDYLTDGEGRALYMFTADTRAGPDTRPDILCAGQCLKRWPPFIVDDKPKVGAGVNPEMLDTMSYQGRKVVTYNGWPLYYFVKDKGPAETAGQDIHSFGGEWYLLDPDGEMIHPD